MENLKLYLLVLWPFIWFSTSHASEAKKDTLSKLEIDYFFSSELIYTETITGEVVMHSHADTIHYSKIQHAHSANRQDVEFQGSYRRRGLSKSLGVFYQDSTYRGISFPDLKVGDTIYYKLIISHHEPDANLGYSSIIEFRDIGDTPDVSISYNTPDELKLKFDAVGVESKVEHVSQRTNTRFRFNNRIAKENIVHRKTAEIAVSSYKDYNAIGFAYWSVNKSKLVNFSKFSKFGGLGTKTADIGEIVRQSYNWVQKNITYKDVSILDSGFSSRDLDVINGELAGDCKDHVLLLQAILAKHNIFSQAALVSSGSSYTLPKLPITQAFDHVILYVPALRMYLDTTSKTTSFGSLPVELYGKPVLLVSSTSTIDHIDRLDNSSSTMLSVTLALNDKRKIVGTMVVRGRGIAASAMRSTALNIRVNESEGIVNKILTRSGVFDSSNDLIFADNVKNDSFVSTLTFTGRFTPDASDSFKIPLRSIINADYGLRMQFTTLLNSVGAPQKICRNVEAAEEYDIQLPSIKAALKLPSSFLITNKYFEYRATYVRVGDRVRVRRHFVPSALLDKCATGIETTDLNSLKKIASDLNEGITIEF